MKKYLKDILMKITVYIRKGVAQHVQITSLHYPYPPIIYLFYLNICIFQIFQFSKKFILAEILR